MIDQAWTPAPLAVYVEGKSDEGAPYRMRLGAARTLEAARKLARDNERVVSRSTVAGILSVDPDRHPRTYRIFESTGWTEVD